MLILHTLTKKSLEEIIRETFSRPNMFTANLLDSLKRLGLAYATNAGISLSIDELKTPQIKQNFITTAVKETAFINRQGQIGYLSSMQKLNANMERWNSVNVLLRNTIINYYEKFDPANNLYLMVFSGARGNTAQINQLVGMRGLMANHEGCLMDLPVINNFHGGLSSLDYVLSSYGARKGIIDTALKTAETGYLTRRLVYIAHDLTIREKNCNIKEGLLIHIKKNTNLSSLLGRVLISIKSLDFSIRRNRVINANIILTENYLKLLYKKEPLILNIRSILTCQSNGSICQECYGWDVAKEKMVSLGTAIGTIAAQSLGEPTTQLTLQTFHVGGTFKTKEYMNICAAFSGTLILPRSFKYFISPSIDGSITLALKHNIWCRLINWRGKSRNIFVARGFCFSTNNFLFIKKEACIASYIKKKGITDVYTLQPIYTAFVGELFLKVPPLFSVLHDNQVYFKPRIDSIGYLKVGKIFSIPEKSKYLFPENLNIVKAFLKVQIITPFSGIIIMIGTKVVCLSYLNNQEQYFSIDLLVLRGYCPNSFFKVSFLTHSFSYVDRQSILGYIVFYPIENGQIYSVRRQRGSFKAVKLLIVTEKSVRKINYDKTNVSSLPFNNVQKDFSLQSDGFKRVFQLVIPMLFPKNTFLAFNQGKLLTQKSLIGGTLSFNSATIDITQGLPQLEALLEIKRLNLQSVIARRPGIYFKDLYFIQATALIILNKNHITVSIKSVKVTAFDEKLPIQSVIKSFSILHSIYLREGLSFFHNKMFRLRRINVSEFLVKKLGKKSTLKKKKAFSSDFSGSAHTLYIYKNKKTIPLIVIPKQFIFDLKNGDLLIKISRVKNFRVSAYLLLERITPLIKYKTVDAQIPSSPSGSFFNLGEPLISGFANVYDLLQTFFMYHYHLDGLFRGMSITLSKIRMILVNSIQAVYSSQNIIISNLHIEIVVRQMTEQVRVVYPGSTPLCTGELIRWTFAKEFNSLHIQNFESTIEFPTFQPCIFSITQGSLKKEGFFRMSGFQNTKKVLTDAAVKGTKDWLHYAIESSAVGRLLPSGSTFFNYKNYLDMICLFKCKNVV